jgi:hypothetical protein
VNGLRRLAAANPVPASDVHGLAAALPGPPEIEPDRRRRSGVRRLALLGAGGVAVALAAPALALHSQLTQSINDFLQGSAPEQAKSVIGRFVRDTARVDGAAPDEVTLEVNANGPEGSLQLYKLHFANGDVGATIIDTSDNPPRFRGGVSWGPPRPLADGQALDLRGSGVERPGRTPFYFSGLVNAQVAKVEVVYPNGQSQSMPIANGYVMGWVLPEGSERYGDGKVIAENAAGAELARTDFCNDDQDGIRDVQFRPHTSNMPDDPAVACLVPPTPDGG